MVQTSNCDEAQINSVNLTDQRSSIDTTTTDRTNNNIELNLVRNKLEAFRKVVLKDVEQRIITSIEEVLQEIRQHKLQQDEFKNFAHVKHNAVSENTWENRASTEFLKNCASLSADVADAAAPPDTTVRSVTDDKTRERQRRRTLPDKVFVTRESYLTALLEVDHMKTIYHIFFIILIVLFMNSICHDYFVEGRINFGLDTIKSGLDKIQYVFLAWCFEHLVVFTLYFAFKGWVLVRLKLFNQKHLLKFWNNSCLIAYISSQLLFGYGASALCLKLNLPFISASVLLLESTRLLMKMHAFIRFNVARILDGKTKNEDVSAPIPPARVPPFSSYLYFLFAPTLIYRDQYPRTHQIHWRFAAARFLEVVAVAFLYCYIHERHIKPNFFDYGLEPLMASTVIVKIFGMLMPSIITFLCGFYLVLHSWQNFTAELLRFGDRMFYKDWWTAASFEAYFRNWNVVVHDWLYEYIYRDAYTHVFKGSKVGASLTVFLVSALVHEYLLSHALQIFFPVIFVFFGVVGVILVFVTRKFPKRMGNIMLWFSLIVGNGVMMSLYTMEYYASFNCPKVYKEWTHYITPAIWSCYKN